MGLPQREVEIGENTYKFHLIGGGKALKASRKITAKIMGLLPCLSSGKVDDFNSKIYELVMEDFDSLIDTFIDKNALYCNDKLITDFEEHFSGHFMDIAKLLYKVVMENDRDFFHSLPSLIAKSLHLLNERLQANSLPKPEGMEDVLNKVANSVKENLG